MILNKSPSSYCPVSWSTMTLNTAEASPTLAASNFSPAFPTLSGGRVVPPLLHQPSGHGQQPTVSHFPSSSCPLCDAGPEIPIPCQQVFPNLLKEEGRMSLLLVSDRIGAQQQMVSFVQLPASSTVASTYTKQPVL